MTIHLKSTCEVAKAFSVRREKQPDDAEIVVAHLKIAECMIDRDQLDELCGQPVGWSTGALYDELGAPLARVTLTLHRSDWTAAGVIRGGDKSTDPRLTLKDAELSAVTLELAPLGALLACQLSWAAAGDEVDDIADMLGKIVTFDLVLSNGGQGDLLAPLKGMALRDGITSIELQDGDGKTLLKVEQPRTGETVSGFNAAMRLLEKGWQLHGDDPDFDLVRLDASGNVVEKRHVWLNAARACIKASHVALIGGDNVDGFRYAIEKAA